MFQILANKAGYDSPAFLVLIPLFRSMFQIKTLYFTLAEYTAGLNPFIQVYVSNDGILTVIL